jgi:hypothetical protein
MGFCLRLQKAMIDDINRESSLTRESKIKKMYIQFYLSIKGTVHVQSCLRPQEKSTSKKTAK